MSSASGTNGTAAPARAAALTFQEALARLQEYWASVGCAVWQPFNSEVLITTISAHTDPVYASMLCYVCELHYRQHVDIRPFLNPNPVAFEVLKTKGSEKITGITCWRSLSTSQDCTKDQTTSTRQEGTRKCRSTQT